MLGVTYGQPISTLGHGLLQGCCVAAIQSGPGAGALWSIEGVLPSSVTLIFFWLVQAPPDQAYRVGRGDGQWRAPLLT